VAHPGDYRWSSHTFNAQGHAGPNSSWLTPHPLYSRLGRNKEEQQSAYQRLFKIALPDQDLQAIRESTHKGWALGNEHFQRRIEGLASRQAASKGVGRPKV